MNRNKQRQMLRMKREIGFHDIPTLINGAPPAEESATVIFRGVVKVQYAQGGAEAYMVYNQDRNFIKDLKRSQHTRVEWNRLLVRLGMHAKQFWNVVWYSDGTVDFSTRAADQLW
jgi:hypothetical protein